MGERAGRGDDRDVKSRAVFSGGIVCVQPSTGCQKLWTPIPQSMARGYDNSTPRCLVLLGVCRRRKFSGHRMIIEVPLDMRCLGSRYEVGRDMARMVGRRCSRGVPTFSSTIPTCRTTSCSSMHQSINTCVLLHKARLIAVRHGIRSLGGRHEWSSDWTAYSSAVGRLSGGSAIPTAELGATRPV